MREFIEQKLAEFGYTDLEWHYGREGWFILAISPYGLRSVIQISKFVEDYLWLEKVEIVENHT